MKRFVKFAIIFASISALSGIYPALNASDLASTSKIAISEVEVTGVYVLPDTPLQAIEEFIGNDRKILLGSIGSDLWHGCQDLPNRFWMVSDRGPNGEPRVGTEKRRTFPVPDFTPIILQVEVAVGKINILKKVPIVDSTGKPVGGLPNIEGVDEAAYDYSGRQRLEYDSAGLDSEGLVRKTDGHFWLAEEYSPSLIHCDPQGKIMGRYLPIGSKLEDTNYPLVACLPAVFACRSCNRGFEGLAISRDEKTLYAVMQRPLSHPDKRTSKHSRAVRLLAFDIMQSKPVTEYVYLLEPQKSFGTDAKGASDIKLSGLAVLDDTKILVLERTDTLARLYKIDLKGATNILDSKWDEMSTVPTLESLDDLSAVGVTAMTKSLVLDLSRLPNIPRKIEGVAIIDRQTIALANDNDFDLGWFDDKGNNHGAGVQSAICVVRFKKTLLFEK